MKNRCLMSDLHWNVARRSRYQVQTASEATDTAEKYTGNSSTCGFVELGDHLAIGYFEQETKKENNNTCLEEVWEEFPHLRNMKCVLLWRDAV